MRKALYASVLAAFGLMLAVGTAKADPDQFEVKVEGSKVVVIAKGKWHVNKDYPWTIRDASDNKLVEKGAFAFEETKASASAPKTAVKVVGGICSGDQCQRIESAITIK